MLELLVVANAAAAAAIVRRFRIRYAGIPVLAFYAAVVFGVPGSVLTLGGDDWWLLNVRVESIQRAAVLYNLGLILWAVALSLSRRTPLFDVPTTVSAPPAFIALVGAINVGALVVCIVFLLPGSPLFHLIKERDASPLLLAELRGQINVDFQGDALILYFRNLVVRYLMPYSAIYFGLLYHYTRRLRWLYFIALGAVTFALSIDLSKGPILSVLLLVGLVRLVAHRLSLRRLIAISAVFAGTTALLYITVMGAGSGEVAASVAHRLFIAQYVGLPVTVEVFPRVTPYLDVGSVLGQLGKLFGYDYVFYSRVTMDYANPWGVTAGTSGYLSTFAAAEGYAIGGDVGYFAVLAVVFFFLSSLDRHFRPKTDLRWRAFYVLLIWKLPLLIMDSASGMIVNYGILLVYLMLKFSETAELGVLRRLNIRRIYL